MACQPLCGKSNRRLTKRVAQGLPLCIRKLRRLGKQPIVCLWIKAKRIEPYQPTSSQRHRREWQRGPQNACLCLCLGKACGKTVKAQARRRAGNVRRLIPLRDIPAEKYISVASLSDDGFIAILQMKNKDLSCNLNNLNELICDQAKPQSAGWTAPHFLAWVGRGHPACKLA